METTRLKLDPQKVSGPCIWMQGGVVKQKMCRSDYECTACRYDRALRKAARANQRIRMRGQIPAGRRGQIVSWQERLRELPVRKQPCIHHLKRKIGFRSCTHAYSCGDCEFDQYFYDQYTVHAVVKPIDVLNVAGFKIPQGFYLHEGHCWLRIEDGSNVRIGIDDFALRLFGPLDHIEAPLLGKEVVQNREDITIVHKEKRAPVLSPVSGVITAVNPKLAEKGRSAGGNPYVDGWVATLHAPRLRAEVKTLMIRDETKAFLKQEVDRLYDVIDQVVGPLAADGGNLGEDIFGNAPQLGWERLAGMFLRSTQ